MIKDLIDGRSVQLTAICTKRSVLLTKKGKPYVALELRDSSGTVSAKAWDVSVVEDFSTGAVVTVDAMCSLYEGVLQLTVSVCRVAEEGTYDYADLCPVVTGDREAQISEFRKYSDSVTDPFYRSVLDYFFENESIWNLAKEHSAAVTVHHAAVGGWIMHTLNVAKQCYSLTKIYPYLRGNLLVTAALLHDVGKLEELSSFPENKYTEIGYLVGHVARGYSMVLKACEESPYYDEAKCNLLCHCILAHHGELEFGSPKKPAIVEAVALSFADNTDAKLQIAKELLDSGAADAEPVYSRYLGTYFQK